jgi:hypothetical protein
MAQLQSPLLSLPRVIRDQAYEHALGDCKGMEEEGDCIVCLEMRADELMRRLISGELTNYRVVCTRLKPLHTLSATALSK